jgi:integrase
MSKIGRPFKQLIYDETCNLVVGLSYDSAANTYFASYKDKQGKHKKFNCGRDKAEAIAKFRRWQEEGQGGKLLQVIQSPKPKIHRIKALEQQWAERFGGDGSAYIEAIKFISEESIWEQARQLIQDNPVLAAQKLKMPFLSDPNFMRTYKPKKSYTLVDIWNNYLKRVSSITTRELGATKASWTKFSDIVKVKTVSELTKEVIRKYYDVLYCEYNGKMSTTWIKSHFERVKRVMNYALDSLDDISDLLEVKQRLVSVLKSPKDSILCPAKRIPKELFHQIMEASSIDEKAMWLLSINLAYYAIDIATLPLSAINLDEKTVIFRRGKTGVHRAGILWNETIDAIRAYQKENPHRSSTLFQNRHTKICYVSARITEKFNQILEKLGIREMSINKRVNPNNFRHSNFRDSFESICASKNIPQRAIDGVMGHTGIAAKYTDIESAPDIAAPACQAVRDYYFGKEDKKD